MRLPVVRDAPWFCLSSPCLPWRRHPARGCGRRRRSRPGDRPALRRSSTGHRPDDLEPLPEIATNLAAAASSGGGTDASGIAVGNIVGSNFSQITLLMGITGLVAGLKVPRAVLTRTGPSRWQRWSPCWSPASTAGSLRPKGLCWPDSTGSTPSGCCSGCDAALRATARVSRPRTPLPRPSPRWRGTPLGGGPTAVVGGAVSSRGQAQILAEAAGLPKDLVGLFVGVGTGPSWSSP